MTTHLVSDNIIPSELSYLLLSFWFRLWVIRPGVSTEVKTSAMCTNVSPQDVVVDDVFGWGMLITVMNPIFLQQKSELS